jgi:hypothetical protein
LANHHLQANVNLAFNNAPITSPVTWFLDTGANHHVTPDLASMTSSEPYLGNDHLHVGDGKGLVISNIVHVITHFLVIPQIHFFSSKTSKNIRTKNKKNPKK